MTDSHESSSIPEVGASRRLGNASVFVAGEIVSRLLAFAATAYLAIRLGPDPFGMVGFAFAVVTYLTVFVDSGFVDVGSRDVAALDDASEAARLGVGVTLVRTAVAIVCMAALVIAAPILEPDPVGQRIIVLTGLMIFVAAIDPAWIHKGLRRSVPVGISLVMRRLLYAIFVFVFIKGPDDVLRVPLAQAGGELIGVMWLGGALLASGVTFVDLRSGWSTFWAARPLMLAKLLRTSVVTADVVLLGLMATDREVGLYTADYRFCFLVMALAGSIQVAYLPDVTRPPVGPHQVAATRRHMELSSAVGIPVAVGGVLIAGPLLGLVFGGDYLPATAALQILLLSVGLLFVFAPLHNLLLARGQLGLETRAVAVAAGINLVLNLWWIPRYGIVGAAMATLVAEALILTLSAIAVRDAIPELSKPLARPILACVGMTAALLLVGPDRSPLLTIPVGVATYGAFLIWSGGLPADTQGVVGRLRSLMPRG